MSLVASDSHPVKRCVACDVSLDNETWTCRHCGFTPVEKSCFLSFVPANVAEENFEASFFAVLRDLEPGFWWFESRNAVIAWAMGKWGKTDGSFFEIGAGTGFVSQGMHHRFPRLRITASELFPEGLPIVAERLPAATLFQLDALHLPFRDEFDMIGAFDVIEHIERDVDVLVEVRKALKPDGLLLVTVPQHQFLWSANDELAHHKRRYARRELESKLQMAGFEIVALRSFVSLLFPLQVLARLRKRANGPRDETAEFKIPKTLNGILRALMRLELSLIRLGVSFPIGGSLLAVARRREAGANAG
jgi:SAM-dependent methyltransferase